MLTSPPPILVTGDNTFTIGAPIATSTSALISKAATAESFVAALLCAFHTPASWLRSPVADMFISASD